MYMCVCLSAQNKLYTVSYTQYLYKLTIDETIFIWLVLLVKLFLVLHSLWIYEDILFTSPLKITVYILQ